MIGKINMSFGEKAPDHQKMVNTNSKLRRELKKGFKLKKNTRKRVSKTVTQRRKSR